MMSSLLNKRVPRAMLVAVLLLFGCWSVPVSAFQTSSSFSFSINRPRRRISASTTTTTTTTSTTTTSTGTTTALQGIVKPYEHHGYKLSYRYRPSSSIVASTNGPPLVLIHPIGIGLSSWFWRQFINYWDGTNELYAPDLMGCGLENGNDEWNPASEVMLRPDKSTTLAYVEGIETLIREKVLNSQQKQQQQQEKCVVVSQGGLAPVAIELAKRNPHLISHLILISPPTWSEMTRPVPLSHQVKKYRAYTGPMSYMMFDALEKPFGFKTYMQRYFKRKPDDLFVSFATEAGRTTKPARAAIASYNSGALFDRSYEEELRTIGQPTLVLCGSADFQRTKQREQYLFEMNDAAMATVDGKRALPWESPVEVRNAIKAFLREHPDVHNGGDAMEDPAMTMVGGGAEKYDGGFEWGTYGEESSGGAILSEIQEQQQQQDDAYEHAIEANGSSRLNMPPPQQYQHNGYTLTFRHKPAKTGHELKPTLLLIHGIGIGQSSWFWEKIFERYPGEIIAPDLIGCGLENGGDPWDPLKRDVTVPLDWVEGIETLMRYRGLSQMHRCVVVAQNAVAPVGIKLAYRNEGTVSHLVLLSPPCWERLTSEYTTEEQRQQRHNEYVGSAADYYFSYLESKVGYRLKMREFFKERPDEKFISLATAKEATTREARTPIIAVNSGDLNYRSFETELMRMKQPTLILTGSNDKVRTDKRPGFGLAPYSTKMNTEKTVIVNGKILLPWESPDAVMKEMNVFLGLEDDGADEATRLRSMFTRAQR